MRSVNPHRFTFIIRTYEADHLNRLKINSLLNYMQEAAAASANLLGFGYDQLKPTNKFWVLSRVIVELHHKIRFDEKIIIETWPKALYKLLALRDFLFRNPDGVILGKASTAWLLIDSNSQRPVSPMNAGIGGHTFDLPAAIENIPEKIDEPASKALIAQRQVVYSDLDVNNHVNNARYAEMLFDYLPQTILNTLYPASIQINYLKEMRLGDTMKIFSSETNSSPLHLYLEGINQGGFKTFQAQVVFTE